MNKVKIFSAFTWKQLENEVNTFLRVKQKIYIISVNYQHTHNENASEYVCFLLYKD